MASCQLGLLTREPMAIAIQNKCYTINYSYKQYIDSEPMHYESASLKQHIIMHLHCTVNDPNGIALRERERLLHDQ